MMMRERLTAIATSSPSSVSSSLPAPHVGIVSSSAGAEGSLGSSLSCLSWLTTLNVNNLGALSPASYASSQHSSSEDDDGDDILSVDWQSDASRKPPFAYATLIYMALQESDSPKLALAEIYDYISDNLAYYRYPDPGWKVGAHTLCLTASRHPPLFCELWMSATAPLFLILASAFCPPLFCRTPSATTSVRNGAL
jgi:hypothetical protein